jgi:hypothetical protein
MSTRVKGAGEFLKAEIAAFDRFWQCQFLGTGLSCIQASAPLLFLIGRKTIKRFTSIRLPATAAVPQGLRLA